MAQYNLGNRYRDGRGVPKDDAQAVGWYRKSADQGYAAAQYNLGTMYRDGRGVPKDFAEAVQWYRKSADQGYAHAQLQLGLKYAEGRGVLKDNAQAVGWYRKAAEQGDAGGQTLLGIMYAEGRGVPKSDAEAARWFLKAAEQGDADAQGFLGSLYMNGQGVPKDYVQAYMWFNLAAASGKNAAAQVRDGLEHSMTTEQLAEAQQRTAAWQPIGSYQERASAQVVTGIAKLFSATLGKGGMVATVDDIRSCYLSAGEMLRKLAPEEKHLVRLCMIYDSVAYSVDSGMRQLMQAQFQRSAPASDYLTDEAYNQRISTYVGTAFPEEEDIATPYLRDAIHRVLQTIKS